MPHHSTWPRTLAVVLAIAILIAGVWGATRTSAATRSDAARRQELEASRERLFDELAALELRYREEAIDPDRYAQRRSELVSALEGVYAALDEGAVVGRAS